VVEIRVCSPAVPGEHYPESLYGFFELWEARVEVGKVVHAPVEIPESGQGVVDFALPEQPLHTV
jgi:hypothetical protein